ncbi:MAG: BrnT family toxin [Steroidobacteraceae bacterium]
MGSKFDPDKDAANIVKHGLSLVEGEGVLNDPLGLTVEDDSSAGESRWITVGMNAGGEILVVVWTERDDGERLISVRRATPKERKNYEG